MGSWGGEDSCCCGGTETGVVWDKRGRQSDHWQTLRPHIRTDKPRGLDSEWQRTGQAEWWVAPVAPHSHTYKPDKRWGGKQTTQPRAPAWGNKASNL